MLSCYVHKLQELEDYEATAQLRGICMVLSDTHVSLLFVSVCTCMPYYFFESVYWEKKRKEERVCVCPCLTTQYTNDFDGHRCLD